MIGVISAMPEEIQSLLDALKNVTTTTKGKRNYYVGTFKNTQMVIAFSRWGKVAAAVTTTQLINDFKVDEIIFTGVSGALSEELQIGDLVLGTHLYQHDMDARPIFNRFEIPLLGKTYFETFQNLKLEVAIENFQKNIHQQIEAKYLAEFDIKNSQLLKGIIISGDQFIASKEKVAHLKEIIPNALCVEMEGASVAQVCYEYDIPFSIIRIISDNANATAPIDFPKFTNAIACKIAKGILENYCD